MKFFISLLTVLWVFNGSAQLTKFPDEHIDIENFVFAEAELVLGSDIRPSIEDLFSPEKVSGEFKAFDIHGQYVGECAFLKVVNEEEKKTTITVIINNDGADVVPLVKSFFFQDEINYQVLKSTGLAKGSVLAIDAFAVAYSPARVFPDGTWNTYSGYELVYVDAGEGLIDIVLKNKMKHSKTFLCQSNI